jgi:hypothetical protein
MNFATLLRNNWILMTFFFLEKKTKNPILHITKAKIIFTVSFQIITGTYPVHPSKNGKYRSGNNRLSRLKKRPRQEI